MTPATKKKYPIRPRVPRAGTSRSTGRRWNAGGTDQLSLARFGLGLAAQGVTTALWISVGAATVVETLSTGIVSGPEAVVAVLGAAVGYLGVGLWEETIFRGVLVRNGVDGLVARGLSRRMAFLGIFAGGVVLFGLPHFLVPARGASAIFAALQAVSAVVYFTTAYVLTESLALPVGLHFSMNFTYQGLLPPAGSSVPALVRVDRTLSAEPSVVAVILSSTVLLTLGVVVWVRLTRGTVSVRELFDRTGADSEGDDNPERRVQPE